MQLKIYIKQTQQFNIQQQPIYYYGQNPQSLKVSQGTLPAPRQWQNFGTFIDVTDQVSDLYKLKLTWTQDRDLNGASTPGAFQQKKTASGNLTFEATAYIMLKQWLINDVSSPLNSVDVKIEHVGCGTYEEWVIKPTDLKWCEDGDQLCNFDVNIKQKDPALSCIQRTMIADNHLGWFQNEPTNGKKHPRFSYCNEIRPNGLLVLVWWNGATVWTITGLFLVSLILAINAVIFLINGIIIIINLIIAFINALGGNINPLNLINFLDPGDVVKDFEQKFIESAGCGREHPAPLVRDYIHNVCVKCGIDTDSLGVTAPIFFANTITVNVHDTTRGTNGVFQSGNPHYNLCYFNAPIKRGIRRINGINVFGSTGLNTKQFWIDENAPLLTGDMLLDQLKKVYNAEWRIVTTNGKPKLYFQRKDYFINGGAVLDFTDTASDRELLLQGICFEWNEVKYPILLQGIYSDDSTDTCGNEARRPMNGSGGDGISLSFGNADDNPNFDGILDKTVEFGATKFRMDGASTDYIFDAMQVVVNGSVLAPYLAGIFRDIVAPALSRVADYALLLKDETAALPKLIIWDGKDYMNARSVPSHSAYFVPNYTAPKPNDYYNPSTNPLSNQWFVKNPPQTFVIGSSLTFGNSPFGVYKVQDYFGIPISESPAVLMNYPMYFNPGYEDTLWDWFHWIDDPRVNPSLHMTWTAKVDLCCSMLNRLKVLGDGSGVVVGQKAKLPLQWYSDSKIKEITVSYDPEDELGQYIEIKGTA